MKVKAYLRASTSEQNAERAKDSLQQFAQSKGLQIEQYYTENASGSVLGRSVLHSMLDDCINGDIILLESIDRLTRLNGKDWDKLKQRLKSLNIVLVVLDIPTTHNVLADNAQDEIQQRIAQALNDMFIDLFATFARKDYEQRRERQRQGIDNAKTKGVYSGKPANIKRYQSIIKLLNAKYSHREIMATIKCSSHTIARAKSWHKQQTEKNAK